MSDDAAKKDKPDYPVNNGLRAAGVAAYDAAVTITEPTMRVTDSFSNPMARLGFGTQNLLESSEYPLTRLTQNYMLLNSLYRGNWVVQNIIGAIPEDTVKKWFRITTNAALEYIEKFNKMQRQTKLRQSIIEGMKWGRLYGGAVGLILIAGQEDQLESPLDLDTIIPDSFKGLYIVDRWSGVYPDMELISDINDPDFGLPAYYEIRNESGVMTHRVHHSRVVRFVGRQLPFWERIVEMHWGQSEIESIYDEIVRRDNVAANIASLTFRANISVYEMDNLDQLFAVGGTQAQMRFWNMIQSQSVLESNLGVKMVNKGDNVKQLQYSFAGLADVYEQVMMDVAGASRIPVTKLFGRSPSGLNATGESDLQNYYDYIEERRETDFRPIIERLLPIMALSAWGEIPDDLDFTFEAVRTASDEEKANNTQKKVAVLIETFNAHGMTQEAFMKELKALTEASGLFANITDEMVEEGKGVWARDLTAMLDPFAGIMSGGTDGFEGFDQEPEPPEPGSDMSVRAAAKAIIRRTMDSGAKGGVGVLVINNGKVLVGVRSDNGQLCGPGGHIEPGETPEQAAIRETQEEFGITPLNMKPLGRLTAIAEEYNSPQIYYCTEYAGALDCKSDEMAMPMWAKWQIVEEVPAALFPPFRESLKLLRTADREYTRGGNPENPGQFSSDPGGGGESDDTYENAVDKRVLSYIDEVKEKGPKNVEPLDLGEIDKAHADRLSELTGNDYEGYSVKLPGDSVQHIEKRHGANGEHDRSMSDPEDIARIGWITNNFDDAKLTGKKAGNYSNSDNTPSDIVLLSKRINGNYYVAEAVPDSKKRSIYIVSAYRNKAPAGA